VARRSLGAAHWHTICNTTHTTQPTAGKRVGTNLSACESKQIVAGVWRPTPVTGNCTFSQIQGDRVPRAERHGRNLGGTQVRFGSPDACSRRAWRFPPSVAESRMSQARAAAVLSKHEASVGDSQHQPGPLFFARRLSGKVPLSPWESVGVRVP